MKKDCFAYKKNESKVFCKALDKMSCEVGGCAFYKTKEEQDRSVKKANTRLVSLDKTTQQNIADKYYKGKHQWKENK